ncbi:MAG: sugar transferase [Pseudomonadota bacterium]
MEMFAHRVKTTTVIEFVADTAVCFAAALLAFKQILPAGLAPAEALESATQGFRSAAAFAVVMSLMYSFVGLYRRSATLAGVWSLVRRAFLAVLIGAAIAYLALVLDGKHGYAIQLLGRAVCYVSVGAVLVRSLSYVARSSSLGVKRVLIVGTGAEAQEVARDIRRTAGAQAALVGFYPTGADEEQPGGHPKVFSREVPLDQLAQEYRVHEIVVAVREQRGGAVPMTQLLACRIQGIRVLDLAGFYERVHSEVPTDSLKASWLVYGHGFVQSTARIVAKRGFDLVFSSVLLILAAPVMLLTMLAIKLESPGPIIYRQERVGLGGRSFMCRKFRSMRSDAESDGVARWATKNDSRVTRVGSFIRKTRIDELPQLISVLQGEMSLVGPRPERPSFVAELKETIPFYDIRHSVKPGVTGWAQVRYGYCATLDDSRRKHQFDLYYVKNNSFSLDLLVLIETVSVVLFREGSQ